MGAKKVRTGVVGVGGMGSPVSPDYGPPDNAFFKHVDKPMRIMADLLRRNRPASEVMAVLAREETDLKAKLAKAGRNDPCPCGSGKKVKHCHGK